MSFIKIIDKIVDPLLEEIIQHPFLKKLSDGTLNKKTFNFYLEQDYYYLLHYTQALLLLSEKTSNSSDKIFLKICAESCMHEPAFEIKHVIVNNDSRKTNACSAYIQFIQQAIVNGYNDGLFSIFPCFYVYYRVSKKLYPTNKNNPFIEWFKTYTSELFETQTKTIIELIQKEYEISNQDKKSHLLNIIQEGVKHELCFWDDTYL